jgi:hypothetical protein
MAHGTAKAQSPIRANILIPRERQGEHRMTQKGDRERQYEGFSVRTDRTSVPGEEIFADAGE